MMDISLYRLNNNYYYYFGNDDNHNLNNIFNEKESYNNQ
jgi:hypothetical protein